MHVNYLLTRILATLLYLSDLCTPNEALKFKTKVVNLIKKIMKKASFIFMSLFMAQLAIAGNHIIVIHNDTKGSNQKTEVGVDQTANGDVITITPSKDVNTITVTVKDEYGEVVAEGDVPANTEGVYVVNTPGTTGENIIEVSDDNGVVFTE